MQYQGTIVENSLENKDILNSLKVEKKYTSGDWTLYDVFIDEERISILSNHLAKGPWYMHFWKPGADEIKVVFRNKLFSIKQSDKSTWADAIAYGQSLGIPIEQLDFLID